jgi:hypothetical protein
LILAQNHFLGPNHFLYFPPHRPSRGSLSGPAATRAHHWRITVFHFLSAKA